MTTKQQKAVFRAKYSGQISTIDETIGLLKPFYQRSTPQTYRTDERLFWGQEEISNHLFSNLVVSIEELKKVIDNHIPDYFSSLENEKLNADLSDYLTKLNNFLDALKAYVNSQNPNDKQQLLTDVSTKLLEFKTASTTLELNLPRYAGCFWSVLYFGVAATVLTAIPTIFFSAVFIPSLSVVTAMDIAMLVAGAAAELGFAAMTGYLLMKFVGEKKDTQREAFSNVSNNANSLFSNVQKNPVNPIQSGNNTSNIGPNPNPNGNT